MRKNLDFSIKGLAVMLLCASPGWIGAQDNPVNALEIVHNEGENTYVKLTPETGITFQAESSVMVINGTETLSFDDIKEIKHVHHVFQSSGLNDVAGNDDEIQFNGHVIVINTADAVAYSPSGVCLGHFASDNGRIEIDLRELDFSSTGIVVLRYGDKSIKIQK